jgi:hypothetical protein
MLQYLIRVMPKHYLQLLINIKQILYKYSSVNGTTNVFNICYSKKWFKLLIFNNNIF